MRPPALRAQHLLQDVAPIVGVRPDPARLDVHAGDEEVPGPRMHDRSAFVLEGQQHAGAECRDLALTMRSSDISRSYSGPPWPLCRGLLQLGSFRGIPVLSAAQCLQRRLTREPRKGGTAWPPLRGRRSRLCQSLNLRRVAVHTHSSLSGCYEPAAPVAWTSRSRRRPAAPSTAGAAPSTHHCTARCRAISRLT